VQSVCSPVRESGPPRAPRPWGGATGARGSPMTTATAPESLPDMPPTRPAWWPWVLCLLGVDYFSTLAYQPSLSFQLAGRLAPLATVLVVLLTLFGAVPVYWFIAGRSAHGQGSIALLE